MSFLPWSDGSLLGFVNRGSGGILGSPTEQAVALTGPSVGFSAQQPAGQWLGSAPSSGTHRPTHPHEISPPPDRLLLWTNSDPRPPAHVLTTQQVLQHISSSPHPSTKFSAPMDRGFCQVSSPSTRLPCSSAWGQGGWPLFSTPQPQSGGPLLCAFATSVPLESSFTPLRS